MTPKEALEKVLKIGKKKQVNVHILSICNIVDEYNKYSDEEKLTESEFNLLKEYLK